MPESIEFWLRVTFWCLALSSAVLPMRWALLSFILISHIDITPSTYASASSIGVENAVKTIILPTILWLRFARASIWKVRSSSAAILWLSLTAYAMIACIWSPFVLSGLKMVAYLYCYLILGAVFLEGWNRKQLTSQTIGVALWVSLLMGAVQTYLLGNLYGASPNGLDVDRFTSFCSPQQFGAFLLTTLSILFVTSRQGLWAKLLHAFGGFVGIGLCGSRYVFLGSLALLPIVWASFFFRSSGTRQRTGWIVVGIVGCLVAVTSFGGVVALSQNNRISSLVLMTLEGRSPLENVGTFVWRQGIYEQAWNQLKQRKPVDLLFGAGTSSGALVVLGWDRRYRSDSVDANRVMHNELLRVVFEWGILGLTLFISFGVTLTRQTARAVRLRVIPAYAFLALLPTIVLGCLSENVLAASSSPAGVGFSLVLFYGISYCRSVTIGRRRELSIHAFERTVHET
jgi:hypothetical protein